MVSMLHRRTASMKSHKMPGLLVVASLCLTSLTSRRRSEEHTTELQSRFDLVRRCLSARSYPSASPCRRSSVLVAAREVDPHALRENQLNWITRHTVYTHGNGFVAAQANRVDEVAQDAGSTRGGFPVFNVSDLQT